MKQKNKKIKKFQIRVLASLFVFLIISSIILKVSKADDSDPQVEMLAITEITDSSATFSADILNADDGDTITKRGFEYYITQSETDTTFENGDFSNGEYSLSADDLVLSQNYFVRPYIVADGETIYGSYLQFRTKTTSLYIKEGTVQ